MNREVIWSEDFDRQFKKLARRRRRIYDDLSELLDRFESGQLPGRDAQDVEGLPVKIARMTDRSSNRGKSGGYRVAYYYDDSQILLTYITPRDKLDQNSTTRIMNTLAKAGLYP